MRRAAVLLCLSPVLTGLSLSLEPTTGSSGWPMPSFDQVADGAWGDVDGDGDLDLVVGTEAAFGDFALTLFTNAGGELETGQALLDRTSVHGAGWLDVDDDDDLDLVALISLPYDLDKGDSTALVLFSNVGGTLAEAWTTDAEFGETGEQILVGDVDGDGRSEVLERRGMSVRQWSLDIAGPAHETVYEGSVHDMEWVDLDVDGDLDVSMTTDDGVLFLVNEHGTLAPEDGPRLAEGEVVDAIAWGDWLRDGGRHPAVVVGDEVRAFRYVGGSFQERLRMTRSNAAPTAVAWADFDADGDADLAVGWDDGTVEVFEAFDSFTGVLLESAWEDGEAMKSVSRLVPADWDGDGDLDLFVGRAGWVSGVYESLAGAAEGDQDEISLVPDLVETVDLDGDGGLDLLLTVVKSGSAGWTGALYRGVVTTSGLEIRDEGAWLTIPEPTEEGADASIADLAAADWDGDGDLDIALATGIGLILLEQQDDRLFSVLTDAAGSPGCRAVAFADADADGDLDLIAAGPGRVRVLTWDGGAFQVAWETSEWSDPTAVTWANLDGDGRMQAIVAHEDGTLTRVARSLGGGWEQSQLGESGLLSVLDLARLDADVDGDDELVAVGRGADRVLDLVDGALRATWVAPLVEPSFHVYVTDHDRDGVEDLVVATGAHDSTSPYLRVVHHRRGAWLTGQQVEVAGFQTPAAGLADPDADGDVDIILFDSSSWTLLWNGRRGSDRQVRNPPRLALEWAGDADRRTAVGRAAHRVESDGPLGVRLRLIDAESDPVTEVRFEFRDAAGGWRLATMTDAPGAWTSKPAEEGGGEHLLFWDWAADEADGEDARLRAVLPYEVPATGSARLGRVATEATTGQRLFSDRDGDGVRDTTDPCPDDAEDDSLVAGVCDSVVLAQGWWCGVAGPRGLRDGMGLVAVLALVWTRRRRERAG